MGCKTGRKKSYSINTRSISPVQAHNMLRLFVEWRISNFMKASSLFFFLRGLPSEKTFIFQQQFSTEPNWPCAQFFLATFLATFFILLFCFFCFIFPLNFNCSPVLCVARNSSVAMARFFLVNIIRPLISVPISVLISI